MDIYFIDLGKTVLDNKGYNNVNAINKVYELTNKSVPFNYFYENWLNDYKDKKITNKDTNKEFIFGDQVKEVINKLNLKTSKTSEELEIAFFDELTKNEGLIDKVYDLLKAIKDNNDILIAVSNSCITSNVLKRGLDKLKILQFFNDVISSANVGYGKPEKIIFDKAIEQAKIISKNNYKNMYFIGNDYKADIIGSKNANLLPIWYNVFLLPDYNKICYLNINDYSILINRLKIK